MRLIPDEDASQLRYRRFNFEETVSTLRFAQRAKTIKTRVHVNLQRSTQELEAIIVGLRQELAFAKRRISVIRTIPQGDDLLKAAEIQETENVEEEERETGKAWNGHMKLPWLLELSRNLSAFFQIK